MFVAVKNKRVQLLFRRSPGSGNAPQDVVFCKELQYGIDTVDVSMQSTQVSVEVIIDHELPGN